MKETRWMIRGTNAVDGTEYGPHVSRDYPTPTVLLELANKWTGEPSGEHGQYETNVNFTIEAVNIEIS